MDIAKDWAEIHKLFICGDQMVAVSIVEKYIDNYAMRVL